MAQTYLADAQATGRLAVHTNRKAYYVARYGSQYRVVYWKTDSRQDNYHIVNSGSLYYMDAPMVVVAGGTIESPVLLSRSLTEALPAGYTRINAFPTTDLGRHIDGTGDFAVGGFVPQQTDTYKGAIMMANIDMGDYVLEDLHAIPVGPAVKLEAAFTIAGKDRTWGLAYKQRYQDFAAHLLLIGVVGKSPSGANMSVTSEDGNVKLSAAAYQPPTGSMEAARSIITALGGQLAKGPWERSGIAATVHPVGGCKLGSIVQPTDLQVYNNAGLYVVDGSVLPGGIFRNPANTIAAIAEKAMDVILQAPGAPTW
jgi:choline dehydrogenase-like flavoprotein